MPDPRHLRTCALAAFLCLVGATLRAQPVTPAPPVPGTEGAPAEKVTFDEAVRRALERNPSVGQATQAIARSRALLDQARSVFRPLVTGTMGATILDDERGFDGMVTVPQRQSAFGAAISYPVLAASRWAARNQAADQVQIATLSAEETRRQVALQAADAYLAVIGAQRQLEFALRSRETAQALAEYARLRLEAGQGSRLNFVRASQEVATAETRTAVAGLFVRRAQEALGVAIFADGPVDADGDPQLERPASPADESWLRRRPDVRLFTAQAQAAERVARDAWKSWLPTGVASFAPLYVTPRGLFEPAGTWRALFQLQIPIYDATLAPVRQQRIAERETARLRLDQVTLQARSEVRFAQEAVTRNERIVAAQREATERAAEVLRITEVAYRAGATTNIEVVQAQESARNAETALAVAEDQLRQARLDLLVALGQFPR